MDTEPEPQYQQWESVTYKFRIDDCSLCLGIRQINNHSFLQYQLTCDASFQLYVEQPNKKKLCSRGVCLIKHCLCPHPAYNTLHCKIYTFFYKLIKLPGNRAFSEKYVFAFSGGYARAKNHVSPATQQSTHSLLLYRDITFTIFSLVLGLVSRPISEINKTGDINIYEAKCVS